MSRDIRLCGDSAATVVFRQEISTEVNRQIYRFCLRLEELAIKGITEIVPAYCAVTIHFDPTVLDFSLLEASVQAIGAESEGNGSAEGPVIEIPVAYGGEFGPDLGHVAQYAGLSQQEVIKRHSAPEYLIYMLGFTPGFPYLGGMDESIATPRLEVPRTAIPGGSVGIAGKQTGVYPIDSPGGWQLIGRTPIKLFDINRDKPFLLEAGQRVRFVPISADEYERLAYHD